MFAGMLHLRVVIDKISEMRSGMLGDGCGIGKTIQALRLVPEAVTIGSGP
jgi:hypothetical protein